jgi:hypothetical protein
MYICFDAEGAQAMDINVKFYDYLMFFLKLRRVSSHPIPFQATPENLQRDITKDAGF